jgi:hypothetical protein
MQTLLSDEQPKPGAPPAKAPAPAAQSPLPMALGIGGLALALILGVLLFLANRKIDALQERVAHLAATNDARAKDMDLSLAAVKGQTKAIAERTGVTEAELERTATAARELREAQGRGQKDIQHLGGEVGKVKEGLAANQAAIEEANAKLSRAMGDLGEQSGLIARNAEELDGLKRAGLREYVEFDLKKGKAPTPVGPVAIRLKDADVKRHKFNMLLVVDDLEIEKKDKTLLEPVQFYRKGSRQLQEIVVYTVDKDRIVGYLSMPKPVDTATP